MDQYPAPIFEGFAIEMIQPRRSRKLRQIVAAELGRGWKVKRFGDGETDYEVWKQGQELSLGDAWQLTYRLRAQPGVAYAEPLFTAAVSGRLDWNQAPAGIDDVLEQESVLQGLCGGGPALPASAAPEWSLAEARVHEAWAHFFPVGPIADGIVIGHPDTGYRPHPEIVENLLINKGYDFVADDNDALDPLQRGPLLQPGHGTGTSSVIVSPRGAPSGSNGAAVSGVAPGAKLIPIRVSPSVVLMSMINLARAIEHAADQGAHIISISMGGVFSWRLRQAVVYAQRRGVIVLAAAGNCVKFVVWPAAYAEVIACAASNAVRKTWTGSCRGSAIDVTAPGESVWVADVDAVTGDPLVGQGSGTSYAVALVAGVAALWLAHHGRDNLVQQYGVEKIPAIFNQILRETCTPVDDTSWEPGKFGAGLVNAEAALAAPLPDLLERVVATSGTFLEEHVAIDDGGQATFGHLFERSLEPEMLELPPAAPASAPLRSTLARLLNTSQEQLPVRLREVGQELAFRLAVDPRLYSQFSAALQESAVNGTPREGATEAVRGDAALESVRASLVSSGTSRALSAALEGRR